MTTYRRNIKNCIELTVGMLVDVQLWFLKGFAGTAAGIMEAAKNRQLKAYMRLSALRAALTGHQANRTTRNKLKENLQPAWLSSTDNARRAKLNKARNIPVVSLLDDSVIFLPFNSAGGPFGLNSSLLVIPKPPDRGLIYRSSANRAGLQRLRP